MRATDCGFGMPFFLLLYANKMQVRQGLEHVTLAAAGNLHNAMG